VENINGLCGGLVHIVLASLASQTSNSRSSACWQDYSTIHPEKERQGDILLASGRQILFLHMKVLHICPGYDLPPSELHLPFPA